MYNDELNKFGDEDLSSNPAARLPICLCLDVSGSMNGAPINELNDGVRLFLENIKNDAQANASAEIAIVTFGSEAKVVSDYSHVEEVEFTDLEAYGRTTMGAGVNLALDILEERKNKYKDNGIEYFQPWLVIMTDGYPTDDHVYAAQRTCTLINDRKLTIFPIGVGDSFDPSILNQFSPKNKAKRLKGLKFSEFFEWLSKSVSAVSRSTPAETVLLDNSTIDTWSL